MEIIIANFWANFPCANSEYSWADREKKWPVDPPPPGLALEDSNFIYSQRKLTKKFLDPIDPPPFPEKKNWIHVCCHMYNWISLFTIPSYFHVFCRCISNVFFVFFYWVKKNHSIAQKEFHGHTSTYGKYGFYFNLSHYLWFNYCTCDEYSPLYI